MAERIEVSQTESGKWEWVLLTPSEIIVDKSTDTYNTEEQARQAGLAVYQSNEG